MKAVRLGLGFAVGVGFGGIGPGGIAWAQGAAQFDGQYVGQLTLTQTVQGDCTQPPPGSLYPLTVSRGEVRFKYVPRFDTVLSGTVGPTGVFKASARVRSGLIQMTGRIQGSRATAEIMSPSCNYTFRSGN